MSRLLCVSLACLLALPWLPCPAPACTLCGSSINQRTLRQELGMAKMVAYGTLQNPRAGDRPGSGTTELHVLKVLKPHPYLQGRQAVTVNRYIPVLDPKDPPKFLVFMDVVDGKVDAYHGRPVESDALLKYLTGLMEIPESDVMQRLLYCFDFLGDKNSEVSGDAYLEFAKADDNQVAEIAKKLPADRLRRLLLDPATPAERLTLFAFLLGAAGDPRDAALLEGMIDQPTQRTKNSLDGLLCGYIQLRPAQGWKTVWSILGDGKRSTVERLAVSRVLRFYYNCAPEKFRPQVLEGLKIMVRDENMADLAVEDLRRWKIWDLTGEVLAQYGKRSHASPIIRRGIVRYALECPLPQARQFVEVVRREDRELVEDVEETLRIIQSTESP